MTEERGETDLPVGLCVAMMLLAVDQELAAKVLRSMSDDSVDKVTRSMQELQEMTIEQKTVQKVFELTASRLNRGGMALGDVSGAMQKVLVKAFGEDRGSDVTRRANSDILARRPFAMFESLTPEDLASILTEEHPQIAAVFIAHLDRKKGSEILKCFDEEVRANLLLRVATLDRTPAEVVQRVLEVMRKKVKDLGLTALRTEPKAWVKAAAEILNTFGGGEKALLEKIEAADAATAASIREEMFTFEDIAKLDKKTMQKILAAVDSRQLSMAIKGAGTGVEDKILGSLSKRAADLVREEKESLGPTPLSEVVAAQQQILDMIRQMVDKGEIKVGGGAEQLV